MRVMKYFRLLAAVFLLTVPGTVICGEEREGEPPVIKRIDIVGARRFSEKELSRVMGITSGMSYSVNSLDRSCSSLLRLYGDAGYPWARVDVYVLADTSTGGKEVLFSLEEGKKAKINDVLFTGNEITLDRVLERQVGIKSGDQFSLRSLEEGRKRLASWDMFDEVMEPRVYEDENPYRVSLLVPLRESRPNRLTGMLGFGSGKSDSRKVWGDVGFLMKNIMGTARRFEMKWAQTSVDETSLAVNYREPWIAGTPLSGDFSFSQRLRESVFTQIELGAGVSAVFADFGRIGIGYSHEELYPDGTEPGTVTASGKNSITTYLDWKGLDGPLSTGTAAGRTPTLKLFSLKASYGIRREGGESAGETIVDSRLETVVWRKSSAAVRILGGFRAAFRSGGLYPLHLSVPFGGSRTLRGHREGEISILRSIWTQNEFCFLKRGRSDVHLFIDQALLYFPTDTRTLERSFMTGYGAGMRAQTSVGLLELDLALVPGKGFGEARLHVGLGEEF